MYYEIDIEHYNREGEKIDIRRQSEKIEKITEETINKIIKRNLTA